MDWFEKSSSPRLTRSGGIRMTTSSHQIRCSGSGACPTTPSSSRRAAEVDVFILSRNQVWRRSASALPGGQARLKLVACIHAWCRRFGRLKLLAPPRLACLLVSLYLVLCTGASSTGVVPCRLESPPHLHHAGSTLGIVDPSSLRRYTSSSAPSSALAPPLHLCIGAELCTSSSAPSSAPEVFDSAPTTASVSLLGTLDLFVWYCCYVLLLCCCLVICDFGPSRWPTLT